MKKSLIKMFGDVHVPVTVHFSFYSDTIFIGCFYFAFSFSYGKIEMYKKSSELIFFFTSCTENLFTNLHFNVICERKCIHICDRTDHIFHARAFFVSVSVLHLLNHTHHRCSTWKKNLRETKFSIFANIFDHSSASVKRCLTELKAACDCTIWCCCLVIKRIHTKVTVRTLDIQSNIETHLLNAISILRCVARMWDVSFVCTEHWAHVMKVNCKM